MPSATHFSMRSAASMASESPGSLAISSPGTSTSARSAEISFVDSALVVAEQVLAGSHD